MYGGCLSSKKVNPWRFSKWEHMTDFGKTWYVGSGGHKFNSRGLSSPNAHI